MVKCLICFLIPTLLVIASGSGQLVHRTNAYDHLRNSFLHPPAGAHPKVYWWCLNGNIDTVRAKQELLAMKEAGISGFDLFEIGVPKQDKMIPGGPAFLSDESLKAIRFAINETGKLGLTVGLNLASSWNAGGSWVEPKHGGKSLYFSKTRIDSTSKDKVLKLPFPEVKFPKGMLVGGTDKPMVPFRENGKPVYYEEVAVLAIPVPLNNEKVDPSRIIDLSKFLDSEKDVLTWKAPPGAWEIHRYVSSNSGQQLVLPSPASAGLTIDHFDSTAVEMHLMHIINRLQPVLGDFRKTALKSFYLASYEARGFVWTPTLPAEFEKLNGYSITKYIPSLVDPALFDAEITQKVQADFKKTLSELMINNLYKKAKRICNSYGLEINSEAGGPGFPLYNGPAEPLKALGALDIPRGEFWVNHSRYYKDTNGIDSIDILRVVKEVAAASRIYGRKIVEEEAFTSFQNWQEGPFDIKFEGDRAFCEGMNKVVFHGFSHNTEGVGYPGFVYSAGTHFNDKRVWWPKVKPFIDYVTRLSSVFQASQFVSDVVYYYGDKIPNSGAPKNTHFKVGAGYDYEIINTEILVRDLTVKNGRLRLPNGAEFKLLALEGEESVHPDVLTKLELLANQGAIIVGQKPKFVKGGSPESNGLKGNLVEKDGVIPDSEEKEKRKAESEAKDGRKKGSEGSMEWKMGKERIDGLWATNFEPERHNQSGNGKIYADVTPLKMLQSMQVPPDIEYSGKEHFTLDFIHYAVEEVDLYFVANTTPDWISRQCSFRQTGKIPEIWDPVSGKIIPVPIYYEDRQAIQIPLTLAPFGSLLIVFREGEASPHYIGISGNGPHPPLLAYHPESFSLLEDGSFKLHEGNREVEISSQKNIQIIDGEWELFFPPGWGAPEKAILPRLMSWTESEVPGIRYFSGIARYEKKFTYTNTKLPSANEKIFLDLGELSKVGEVWLNGEPLGITWTKPYRFDVTGKIRPGENRLTVEVANTWSNRIVGDALMGEKYTHTNVTNTLYPGEALVRTPWAKVPLIKSGLLGPVTISKVPVYNGLGKE